MSDEHDDIARTRLRRVPVVVRSWDGPNSRIGLEMDLNQMPWGPFDALGQQLSLLLPAPPESQPGGPNVESELAKALRHVEHAADRCAEFARASDGNREIWLESQRTWEWVRRHLTRLWVQHEVEGDTEELLGARLREETGFQEKEPGSETGPGVGADLPSLPGAAATLKAAAKALRSTSLSAWRDTVAGDDPEAPTREEAIQTLLAVSRILDARTRGEEIVIEMAAPSRAPTQVETTVTQPEAPPEAKAPAAQEPPHRTEPDFEQISFDFAEGYDQGYQMGRKVGWALGSRYRKEPGQGRESGRT